MNINETVSSPERVIAYIDGFNLYHGLKEAGHRRYYWLDLFKLICQLKKPAQTIAKVNYFTSRVLGATPEDHSLAAQNRNDSRKRQTTYLEALGTISAIKMIEGKYQKIKRTCLRCHQTWTSYEEKMTDVGIATELLVDAMEDAFDVAIIVSGDSDLVPPMRIIRNRFPKKRLVAAFPPARYSNEIAKCVNGTLHITEAILRQSQLPETILRSDGYGLRRPSYWT